MRISNRISRVMRKLQMLTLRTNKEHSLDWQPSGAMYLVVCLQSLGSSTTKYFAGRLGQPKSINRQTKQ